MNKYVLVNIYLFSYGSHLAFVKEQNDNYHIRLTELNQTEADAIFSLDYIESVRTVKRSDGIIAYIFLKNDDPVLLKSQCVQLIRDIFPSDRAAELTSRAALLINRQYYELAITPHFIRILPTYFLLFLLSCLSICFALQVKNIRSAKEYGYMLALACGKGVFLVSHFCRYSCSSLFPISSHLPQASLF